MSCQGEAPRLVRFARQHPEIKIVAVASRWADPRQTGEFVRDRLRGLRFTLFADRDGALAGWLGFQTHPEFLILDGKGARVGLRFSLGEAVALARSRGLA